MKWVQLFSVTIMAGASIGAVADDVVFRSVDDNGQVVFSDRPADGKLHESVEVKTAKPRFANSGAQQSYTPPEQDKYLREAADLRRQQNADAADSDEAQRAEVTAQRQANCAAAQERAEKYNTRRRLYRPGPNGEREYLNDAELDAARAEAARTVDEWCS